MSDRTPAVDSKPPPAPEPGGGEDLETSVLAYLRGHPDIFQKHPELLQNLNPPMQYGKGVVDLHQFQTRRLQDETAELQQQNGELLQAARANHRVQTRVQEAVLAILEARDFQHFIRVITSELAEVLDVEVVTIGVEGGEAWQVGRVNDYGVFVLGPGEVDNLLPSGQRAALLAERPTDRGLFGAAATLIRSQALVRLQAAPTAPPGLLALGAREPEKFQPGQATDLLVFLGRVIESQLRAWLELPA